MTRLIPLLHLMTHVLRRHLTPPEVPARDPLDPAALRRMSPRDLADLPEPRRQVGQGAGRRT